MQLVEQQRKLKPKPRNRKQKPNPNPNSNPIPNPKPKSEIWIEVAAKNANRCLDKNSSVTHISTRSVCVRECVCGHSRLHWSIFKLCWQAFVYSNSPFRGTKLHVHMYNVPPSLPRLYSMSQCHIPSISIEFDRVFHFGCPHIDRHTYTKLYRGTTYRRRHGGLCWRDKHRGAADSKAPVDNPFHSIPGSRFGSGN